MTAPLAVSQRSGRAVGSRLSNVQVDALRALLRSEVARQTATLARCAAATAADSPEDTTALGRAMTALDMYRARETIEEVEGALARIETGGYGTCSACDRPIPFERLEAIPQARYCAACPAPATPSAGRRAGPRRGPGRDDHDQDGHAESGWPRPASTTAADAPDAVRRLVVLASQLLGGDHEREWPPGSPTALASRLQRVARLRDELHVTANRVARFGVDEQPILDPARIPAPIAAGSVLAPEQLLYRLGLTAGRLVELLEQLPADDWSRTGRMGDRLVALGELVERVLHTGTHDVVDLLHERSRPDQRDSPRPRSLSGKVDRDATAP